MKAIRRFNVRTVLPEPIAALGDLALNLHWSWHPSTRDLFKSIDPVLWDECHQDPTKMLARLSAAELATLANDAEFVARVDVAKAALDHYLEAPRWYQEWAAAQVTEESPGAPRAIAYFSPEFGITHVLPQYSGGLGILAGDHLRPAPCRTRCDGRRA